MAFWQKKSNHRVFVYVRRHGKQVTLPRDITKHLDHSPDSVIDAWVRNFEPPRRRTAVPVSALLPHVEGYLAYLRTRGKAIKTVWDHRRMLQTHILPYFVTTHSLADPNAWPAVSARLTPHLRDAAESEHQILRANAALRGFWEYLRDESVIHRDATLRIRAPSIRAAATPLPRVIEPPEVLHFVRTSAHHEVRLMALLGYFFSLRPQEVFALRKRDFVAGSRAAPLECCRVMTSHGLFGRLAADIHRQQVFDGTFEPPKAYSAGAVACFNEEAARLLVECLASVKDPNALLLRHRPDWNFEKWRRLGLGADPVEHRYAEVTLKDLRRASLYWLGHYTSLDVIALKGHARHRKVDTTMLYLRRPGETVGDGTELDLDS